MQRYNNAGLRERPFLSVAPRIFAVPFLEHSPPSRAKTQKASERIPRHGRYHQPTQTSPTQPTFFCGSTPQQVRQTHNRRLHRCCANKRGQSDHCGDQRLTLSRTLSCRGSPHPGKK
ncbi:unnamed protein product, partial [Ectocarpus sp. 12 AP-2014]